MKKLPLIGLNISELVLLAILGTNCGGGGGGGGGTTTTTTTPGQTGVKSGYISPNPQTTNTYSKPGAVLEVKDAACYGTDTPTFSWFSNSIQLGGASNSAYILAKSLTGNKIKARITCAGKTLDTQEVFINAGSDYAAEELNNLLVKPVSQGGKDLIMETLGYNIVVKLTPPTSDLDIAANSSPRAWSSQDNGFTFMFYENLSQPILEATINENGTIRGCAKNASGSYDLPTCITANDLLQYINTNGIPDLFLFPTEGKTFDELNQTAIGTLQNKGYVARTNLGEQLRYGLNKAFEKAGTVMDEIKPYASQVNLENAVKHIMPHARNI